MLNKLIYQIRLTWRLIRDPRVEAWKKIIPFLGIAYLVSPIDIIPDVILGLGQLDDLGLIWFSLQLFERSIDAAIITEHQALLDGKSSDTMTINTEDYTVSSR